MIVECITIFGIILAIMVIFLRTKKEYAYLTAPLLIIPGINILAYLFSEAISKLLPLNHFFIFVIINLISLIASGVAIGINSIKVPSRSIKITYVIISLAFNIILTSIFVYNMYGNYYLL